MSEEVKGFAIPIHRSLTERILLLGVPRNFAILNGAVLFIMLVQLHSLVYLPIGLIFHLLGAAATKKDPMFFECLYRHTKQKKYYRA